MENAKLTRRDFLQKTGFSAAAVFFGLNGMRPGSLWSKTSASTGQAAYPLAHAQMEPFMPDAEVNVFGVEKDVQILSGARTRVWGYEGELVGGSGVTVQSIPGSYLGPILRVKSGTKLRFNFINNLSEASVIHPHGLRVPENCDGQPMQAIDPGQTLTYDFQVIDRACPAWFHPHPMMRTAYQVAMGMAGLFTVWDDEEALTVPGADTGANDLPIVIQDRTFDSANQIQYAPNMMWGYLGNRILVNGKPNATFSLEPRGYRFRILNGSNARTYKIAWSNGMPLNVIGTDGGLLPAVVTKSYVMLMPGERVDLWVDFGSLAGKQVILRSLSFTAGGMMGGGGGGMGGGGMGSGDVATGGNREDCMCGGGMMGSSLSNGAQFNVLTVNVSRKASVKPALGPMPAQNMPFQSADFPNPVPFTLGMRQMVWTINGRVYEDMVAAEDEMVYLNQPIAWEWINNTSIPHPMHLHNIQFQVLQRIPPSTSAYTTVNQGFLDTGWKDTVSVWPGERVKIAMNFEPYMGMYMYHCHILEHEDMGMMRNFMIMGDMGGGMD